MLVKSHREPKQFELRKKDGKVLEYYLRDNIVTEEVTFEDTTETQYKYDEVKVKLIDRVNLEQFITDNFNDLFQRGIFEETKPNKPSTDERIENLEDTILQIMGV